MNTFQQIETVRRINLQKIIEEKGITWTKLATVLNKNQGYISGIKIGNRPFTEKLSRQIEEKLGLPTGFLDTDQTLNELTSHEEEFISVPEYSTKLSAGSGNHVSDQDVVRYVPLTKDILDKYRLSYKKLCVFTVSGDSMWDKIQNGDRVLVDTSQQTLLDSKTFAINKNDTVLIKKLIVDPRNFNVIVHSTNPTYQQFDFVADESVSIIGQVVLKLESPID